MNHNQDIDDGLDEYLEADQRKQDEVLYRSTPSYFNWLAELGQFSAEKVHEVSLTGVKVEGRGRHPFSYWSGKAVVTGVYEGSRGELFIEWDQNGAILTVSHGVPI